MARCAACNAKVEDGAVRCQACGANLVRPGAFIQTLAYVVIAISTIPFSVAWIASEEGNEIPLAIAVCVLAAGIVMLFVARAKNKGVPPAVIEDKPAEGYPPAP